MVDVGKALPVIHPDHDLAENERDSLKYVPLFINPLSTIGAIALIMWYFTR